MARSSTNVRRRWRPADPVYTVAGSPSTSLYPHGWLLPGAGVVAYEKTGSMRAGTRASGADVHEAVEAGSLRSGTRLSGADVHEAVETGKPRAGTRASGADVHEAVEAGSLRAGTRVSGGDVHENVEAGSARAGTRVSGASATGVGAVTYTKAGSMRAGTRASGADAHDAVRTGKAIADTRISGADSHENVESGSARARGRLSGADVFTASETGKPRAGTRLSGDSYEALVLRPASDVADGNWTTQAGGSDLRSVIDEATASDADYARSGLSPHTTDVAEVLLDTAGDPLSSSGHILRYRYGKDASGPDQVDLTVSLTQREQVDGAGVLVFWLNADWVISLTNTDLDTWKGRGVDGFVMQVGHLEGVGGSGDVDRAWTGNATDRDTDPLYDFQKQIHDNDLVGRCHSRGIKLYAGCYLTNPTFTTVPMGPWFTDSYWTNTVIPAFTNMAAGAALEGFDGLAFDGEMYDGGTWDWNYSGAPAEATVRAKVKTRGAAVMTAILSEFPDVEIASYRHEFVGGIWHTGGYVHFDDSTLVDFWDGMSSVDGYAALRFLDEGYYKGNQFGTIGTNEWEDAMAATVSGTRTEMASEWTNWAAASDLVYICGFSWVDNGPSSPDEDALPAADVVDQLSTARDLSEGNEHFVFCFHALDDFDWTDYLPALLVGSADVGTSVIATWTHTDIASGFTTVTQTLSSGEADAITDYADLRVRFEAVVP